MAIDATARVLAACDAIVDDINAAQTFSGNVTGATNASPIVITTSAAHGLLTGMDVTIASVGGNTAANGTFAIKVLTSTTFSLNDSTGNAAYTSGGTWTCTRFTAARNYLPEYLVTQLTILQVDVRIVRQNTDVIDRQPSSEDVYEFEITIQKLVAPEDTDTLDYLVNLSVRIAKMFYVNMDLDTGLVVVENTHELFDPFLLREHRVFYSRIELGVREYVTN